jgi:hypothetical protein
VVSQITDFLGSDTARPELADGRTLLATALGDMQGMVAAMTGYLMGAQENARELYRLGLESVRFLLAVGDLLIGWLLLNQAEIALNALAGEVSDRDRAFYTGKVAVAKFFTKSVLAAGISRRSPPRRVRPRRRRTCSRPVAGPS